MSKKYMGIIILLTCSFLLLPQNTYSSSTTEDYLQEKCGKSCEEYYRGKNYSGLGSGHTCHYNEKLNKCFIRLHFGGTNYYTSQLFEINENILYGLLDMKGGKMISCSVGDVKCQSLKEWMKLTRPYMEE
jgi:hypothetical protein